MSSPPHPALAHARQLAGTPATIAGMPGARRKPDPEVQAREARAEHLRGLARRVHDELKTPQERSEEERRAAAGKLTFHERAKVANAARLAKATEAQLSDQGRRAAAKAHDPVNLARRILRAWREGKITQEKLAEMREVLSHIEGLFPRRSR